MSYLGLVPSESSTGETRRQGAITKTGSRHARRLLVEAAWHYRKTPARGITLQRRQDGQPATHDRDLLASATTAAPRLASPRRRSAASAARSSRSPSPANSPASAGRSPAPTDNRQPHTPRRSRSGGTWHTRESIRDLSYEQPPRPRSILDSTALTTKPGPAAS